MKAKTVLWASSAVAAILIVVTAVFTVTGMTKASQAKENMNKDWNTLKRFNNYNPFPFPSNIVTMTENKERAEKWFEELLSVVKEGEYVATESNPTPGLFTKSCDAMVDELRKTAPKKLDGSSIVPHSMLFGFNMYSTGNVPDKKDVPRLLKQLSMIENLVKVLFSCDIYELRAVRREEFEKDSAASSGSERTSSRGRRGRTTAAPTKTTAGANILVDEGGSVKIEPFEQGPIGVDRQRFEFVFHANQDSLMNVLNKMAAMNPFVVVSKLEFSKVSKDVVEWNPKGDKKETTPTRGNRRAQVEEPVNPGIVNVKPPSRTARLVSGRNRESLVRVVMGVDVFSFQKEKADSYENSEYDE